jgi:hypothetical protein
MHFAHRIPPVLMHVHAINQCLQNNQKNIHLNQERTNDPLKLHTSGGSQPSLN